MCNRARFDGEPETLHEHFRSNWAKDAFRPNSSLAELYPKTKAYVVREEDGRRVHDVMSWGVLPPGRNPGTNVRNLDLASWRRLAERPSQRCLIPLTEFCEWQSEPTDLGDGKKPVRGEMWFAVRDQPVFAVAGFWRVMENGPCFAMVTCDANELVEPIHPKAMITVLHEDDWERWLAGSFDEVVALQQPYPADRMTMRGPVFPTRRNEK